MILTALLVISEDLSEQGWQRSGGEHLSQLIRSHNLVLEAEALMPPDEVQTIATIRGLVRQGCGLVVIVPGEPVAYTGEMVLQALRTLQPSTGVSTLADKDPDATALDPEVGTPLESAVPVTYVEGALVLILPAQASAQAAVWEDCLPAIERCLPPE